MKKWQRNPAGGFSLVEIALALGVIALAFVTLLGLWSAALDQAHSAKLQLASHNVVTQVSDALRKGSFSPAPEGPPFDVVFSLAAGSPFVVYAYTPLLSRDEPMVITLDPDTVADVDAYLFAARVSVAGHNPAEGLIRQDPFYTLSIQDPRVYPEGFLALRVDLYAVPTPAPGSGFQVPTLGPEQFLYTFHTAVVR